MNRRELITLVAGASLAAPLVVRAQDAGKDPKRVVFLPDPFPAIVDGFRTDMRDLGWVDGRNLTIIESGLALGDLQVDAAVKRAVASAPDVIVAGSTAHALALQRASPSIPIVMLFSGYPVEAGVADSLARPGRNVTGNAIYAGTRVWGKLLQLLRDAKPGIERVGVVWTYIVPAFAPEEIVPCYDELNAGARSLGLKLHIAEANSGKMKTALAEVEAGKPDGLLLTSLLTADALSIATQFAVERRLPTIIDIDWTPFLAPPLPLLTYGPVHRELVRSAAATADRILRGAKPGDLPIQQPSRFELIVSLKTADAIGLTIPPGLVLSADRVIE